MKLSNIRTITKDMLQGGNLPTWLDGFLLVLNDFISQASSTISGKLTFADNMNCKEVTAKFTHNTELSINPSSTSKVTGVLVKDANGQIVTGVGFNRKSNGQVGVTLLFNAGGTTTSTCTIILLFG